MPSFTIYMIYIVCADKYPETIYFWQVHTYSGVLITVQRYRNILLQVFVDVPAQFWKKTAGLCGSYDGDKNNDLILPGVTNIVKHYRWDFW